MDLYFFYRELLKVHGPQGWWPVVHSCPAPPGKRKSDANNGYHPGDYSIPVNNGQQFEIAVGAILTQSTSWRNVEVALALLSAANALSPEAILARDTDSLAALIRPVGYYNQKARKLRQFTVFFSSLGNRTPRREALLSVWGIGPETADSILLYAYKTPEMVIDAYTKRVLSHYGFLKSDSSYDQAKHFCVENLPRDLIVYQEFHALIVRHAKEQLSKAS